jgi:hypothetical protein
VAKKLEFVLKATDQATTTLRKVQSGAGEVGAAFKQLGVFAAAGGAAIAGAVKIVDAAITPFINYARQVKELSLALGTSSEETSRLIQLSDDYKIEVGELRGALQLAVKNGFAPSVENLANLADEMNGIQSPTERAAALSKIFGRNWAVINPLLEAGGDAIREQSAAISENLIMTDEAIAKAREWEIAQDEWQDAIEAGRLAVGRFLVEGLLPYIHILQDLPQWAPGINEAFNNWAISVGLFEEGTGIAADRLRELTTAAKEAHDPIIDLQTPLEQTSTIAGEAAESFRMLSLGLEDTIEQMLNLTIFQAAGGEALGNLAADVATAFDTGGINLQEMNDLMEAIQLEVLNIKVDTELITFEQATSKAEALGISLENPRRMIGAIRNDLEALTDKSITITIEEIRVPHELGVGGPGGFQQGGQFTVMGPQGSDRVPISFLATRGETVTVTPANQAAPSSNVLSGATININSGLDLKAFDAMMRSWLGG